MTRMGWTGRAPAPDGSQSAWGAFHEQEHCHCHASQVHVRAVAPSELIWVRTHFTWSASIRWVPSYCERVSRGRITSRLANLATLSYWHRSGDGTIYYVARELAALGHNVRQVPPAYAKPFRHSASTLDAASASVDIRQSTSPDSRRYRHANLVFQERLASGLTSLRRWNYFEFRSTPRIPNISAT
jgi:hypothetical protein